MTIKNPDSSLILELLREKIDGLEALVNSLKARIVQLEVEALHPNAPNVCNPDDHMYVALAGSALGEGICVKCGATERRDESA